MNPINPGALETILLNQSEAMPSDMWGIATSVGLIASVLAFIITVLMALEAWKNNILNTRKLCVFPLVFLFAGSNFYGFYRHIERRDTVKAEYAPAIASFCDRFLQDVEMGSVKWIHPNSLTTVTRNCGQAELETAANSPRSQLAFNGN